MSAKCNTTAWNVQMIQQAWSRSLDRSSSHPQAQQQTWPSPRCRCGSAAIVCMCWGGEGVASKRGQEEEPREVRGKKTLIQTSSIKALNKQSRTSHSRPHILTLTLSSPSPSPPHPYTHLSVRTSEPWNSPRATSGVLSSAERPPKALVAASTSWSWSTPPVPTSTMRGPV